MSTLSRIDIQGCFNELGVPDFQWWRDYFENGAERNPPPKISPGHGPGWCPRCGYPMLPTASACGRCGKARGL